MTNADMIGLLPLKVYHFLFIINLLNCCDKDKKILMGKLHVYLLGNCLGGISLEPSKQPPGEYTVAPKLNQPIHDSFSCKPTCNSLVYCYIY